jgi:ATP-dependent Clp protease, protease subunit
MRRARLLRRQVLFSLGAAGAFATVPIPSSAQSSSSSSEPANKNAPEIVIYQGPINNKSVRDIMLAVRQATTKSKDVTLAITTTGGGVGPGLALYNFLRGLPAPIATFNLASVESMGTIIFLAGANRVATKDAVFMIHPTSMTLNNATLTAPDFDDRATDLLLGRKAMEDIYRERTTLTASQIEDAEKHQVFFSADQALEAKIINRIAPFTMSADALVTVIDPPSSSYP